MKSNKKSNLLVEILLVIIAIYFLFICFFPL